MPLPTVRSMWFGPFKVTKIYCKSIKMPGNA